MRFTAKHYNELARVIEESLEEAQRDGETGDYIFGIKWLARNIEMMLRYDNPRFNPERFRKAAGLSNEYNPT